MRRKTILAVSALALGLFLAACVTDTPTTPPPVSEGPTVTIRDMQFTPNHVTIEAGDTVTWVWDDGDMPHDVSGDGFRSEVQSEGTYSHTFDEPGDFPYACNLHSGMTGTVSVEG
jgi:plastocyanin